MKFRITAAFVALLLWLAPFAALAQAVLQTGPITSGHAPGYVANGFGQPYVRDSGSAALQQPGGGLSELNVTARAQNGVNSPPYANSGNGPDFTHGCMYDADSSSASGVHYLCFDPNALGGGLIEYGALNGASVMPLHLKVNGATYLFPFTIGGIVGPGTTVVNDFACWNNSIGTLLKDCGANQITGPGTTVVDDVACWDNTTGTLLKDCGPNAITGTPFATAGFGSTGHFQATPLPLMPHAANNAALSAFNPSYSTHVYRDGFASAGDGGGADYDHSATSCSINAGAGDGGLQVQDNASGCWNMQIAPGGVSIKAWGPKCDNATDDATNLNSWLPTVPAGTIITLPAGARCLFTSGDVTLPAFIKIVGLGGQPGCCNGGAAQGSGFVHDHLHHLILSKGTGLEGLVILRSQDGFFHTNPTTPQAIADVYQWWQEYSEGVTQPRGATFTKSKDLFLEGFHVGYAEYTGDSDIDGLNGDCTTLFKGVGSGDRNYLRAMTNEPFYSFNLPQTDGAWQRYGASYYYASGTSYDVNGAQSEGWPLGHVFQSAMTTQSNISSEYQAIWATSPGAFPAEQFGAAIHIITAQNNSIQGFTFGDAGSDGVFSDGIIVDDGGFAPQFAHGTITSIPITGFIASIAGGTAATSVFNITAIPAVGQTVSATVGGADVNAVGGPFTISYVIESGDTPVIVAQRLTYLLNTQRSELAHIHAYASQQTFAGTSTFFYAWPADETVTIATTNLTVSTSSGAARPGGGISLHDVDVSQAVVGGINVGNTTTSRALTIALGDLRFSAGAGNLPANWLTWSAFPAKLMLGPIPWSTVATANLGGTGGAGAAITPSNSTDEVGTVIEGTAGAGFVLTFTTPYPMAPRCMVSGPQLLTVTTTTTDLTVTNTSGNGQVYNYNCKLSVHS